MTSPQLRDRYLSDSINTASPAKLLIMLYDRLVLDLAQGEDALRNGQRESAHDRLTHAQEIVLELRTTELIGANIGRDADRVAACRAIVEPLRDAWREAATAAVAG
jgi:flagellar protein FliS